MKNLILILQTLLLFLLGFLILFSGSIIMESLKSILVSFFLVSGLIALICFIITKDYKNHKYLNLIIGTINIWSSLFMINNYNLFIKILPQIISIFALIIGIILFIEYQNKTEKNKIDLIKIIIPIIYSIFLICKPIELATLYTKLSGLGFIALSLYVLTQTVLEMTNKK